MDADLSVAVRHLLDLSRRADAQCTYTFSDFLGLSEQNAFLTVAKQSCAPYSFFGGTEGCERVMLRFGDPDGWEYEIPFPVVCLHIVPKAAKFADVLTHRDYLGAILNLGIGRETLGDIVVKENGAYLFCEEKIASYIAENLSRVKHTDVTVTPADSLPDGELRKTETKTIPVASERLDLLVAKVYDLSRADASDLVEKGAVFVDGREVTSPGLSLKENAVVSVRGKGRFVFRGVGGSSKKGKDLAVIEKYV